MSASPVTLSDNIIRWLLGVGHQLEKPGGLVEHDELYQAVIRCGSESTMPAAVIDVLVKMRERELNVRGEPGKVRIVKVYGEDAKRHLVWPRHSRTVCGRGPVDQTPWMLVREINVNVFDLVAWNAMLSRCGKCDPVQIPPHILTHHKGGA